MNLVMELPWIQVSFECCDSIRIPYMDKTCWYVYGGIDVRDVGTGLEKTGETLVEVNYVVRVGGSPVIGGRVILAGKSQREKTILWHRL